MNREGTNRGGRGLGGEGKIERRGSEEEKRN
jgi:hypothetical protein